jgi:epoxyqueuosine reductase
VNETDGTSPLPRPHEPLPPLALTAAQRDELPELLDRAAREAGFDRWAWTDAGPLAGREGYEAFLAEGRHGQMDYLRRNLDKRFEPARLVPGATCVICLARSVPPAAGPLAPPGVARYAHGRDYHRTLKAGCHAILDGLRERLAGLAGRAFVDSAPLAERALALRSGLGRRGENGCIYVEGLGSHVLLAEIVCNLPSPPPAARPADPALPDCRACGRCTRTCPTGALLGGGRMDARRCLSYLSIEFDGPVGGDLAGRWGRRLFGCDLCQDVCPVNRRVEPVRPSPPPALGGADLAGVLAFDEAAWDRATRGSAIRRAGYQTLLRNAALARLFEQSSGEDV